MDTEQTLLAAITADPGDEAAWLALADCLEEQGASARAELVRMRSWLGQAPLNDPLRSAREQDVQRMLLEGVVPPVPRRTIEVARKVPLELVLVPAGQFWMGSPEGEVNRMEREGPRHQVTLTKGFWLGIHLVTQRQWKALMGANPSNSVGPDLPVERVTWDEAILFCKRISQALRQRCRLPTEAEWEYACRAGTTSPFHQGSSLSSEHANFDGNYPYGGAAVGPYRHETTPVGTFPPNAWGLYDMHGNVDEWCQDGMRRFTGKAVTNPRCRKRNERGIRGGSWYGLAQSCRSACRYDNARSHGSSTIGFRVLIEAK